MANFLEIEECRDSAMQYQSRLGSQTKRPPIIMEARQDPSCSLLLSFPRLRSNAVTNPHQDWKLVLLDGFSFIITFLLSVFLPIQSPRRPIHELAPFYTQVYNLTYTLLGKDTATGSWRLQDPQGHINHRGRRILVINHRSSPAIPLR